MKLSTFAYSSLIGTLLPTFGLTAPLASTVTVFNQCTFTVYLSSTPNNGGPAGPLQTLTARTGTYAEAVRTSGSAIKIGRFRSLNQPLTQGYTPSNGLLYYDLSDQSGNPFIQFANSLVPSDNSCGSYHCAAGDTSCYSDSSHLHIYACSLPVSLNVTLCA